MSDSHYVQADRLEVLAQLLFFSMKKREYGSEANSRVTVEGFPVPLPGQLVRVFAEADEPVYQETAPFVPSGCPRMVHSHAKRGRELKREFSSA